MGNPTPFPRTLTNGKEDSSLEHRNQKLEPAGRRTIVVGDIHGCYDELIDLLTTIDFGLQDRLIAVGDLIVKGPKNREVLDLFISDSRFTSVLGNHDRALLQFWAADDIKFTKAQKTAARELESGREKYFSYLSSRPLLIDLGLHAVIHAGVRPGIPLDQQEAEDLLELRTLGRKKRTSRKGIPWYEVYAGDKVILFGHWPATQPRSAAHAVGLDTGCVYGHQLTAYIIETNELVSVPARSMYVKGAKRFYQPLAEPTAQRTDCRTVSSESTKLIHEGPR